MKRHLLVLAILFSALNSNSQNLSLVQNQPDLNYSFLDEVEGNFYFVSYFDLLGTRDIYSFDGQQLLQVPFADANQQISFSCIYQNNFVFTDNTSPNSLLKYDGIDVEEIILPNNYSPLQYLAKMNDKIYFKGGLSDVDNIIAYDGNIIETFSLLGIVFFEEFYYSTIQDFIFLRLQENNQGFPKLFKFDGANVTLVESPPNTDYAIGVIHEFPNQLIMSFGYSTQTIDVLSLYIYDGTQLTSIPSPDNAFFLDLIGSNGDKIFLRFQNLDTQILSLYEYSPTSGLLQISLEAENEPVAYFGDYANKDYFSIYQPDGTLILYSYDGTNVQRIDGPENSFPSAFAGLANNKLYLTYRDIDSNYNLVEYLSGTDRATLVDDAPRNKRIFEFLTTYNNKNYYSISYGDIYYKLHVLSENSFQEISVPELYLKSYDFTIENKLYFNFGTNDPYFSKLYSLDGTLDNPEFIEVAKNSIKLFPNPSSGEVTIQISNQQIPGTINLKLFSLEGKIIDSKKFQNTITNAINYDTSKLASGMYLIEISGEFGTAQKKFIKK